MTIDTAAIKAAVDDLTSKTNSALDAIRGDVKAANDNAKAEIDEVRSTLKRVATGWDAEHDNGNGGYAGVDKAALRQESNAISAFVRTGDESGLREIHAGMQTGSDPDGGYLVLPNHSKNMMQKLYDAVPMRQLARVVNIEKGGEWFEPYDKDEVGATWVGESESRPETTNPELGELRIGLDESYCLQKVTQRLLDDSQWDIGGWLMEKVTGKFARSENAAFVSGNGVKKPRGFLTYDTATTDDAGRDWGVIQTVNSGAASAVTADSLRDIYWKLRAPYRAGATWLMSSDTASQLDKLKNGEGEYMWRQSTSEGMAPTLLGLPVRIEENMPEVEAGALPIALGNWSLAYTVLDRPGIRMLRDPYTQKPHMILYSYMRVGGGLSNSEAVKLLKIAAS